MKRRKLRRPNFSLSEDDMDTSHHDTSNDNSIGSNIHEEINYTSTVPSAHSSEILDFFNSDSNTSHNSTSDLLQHKNVNTNTRSKSSNLMGLLEPTLEIIKLDTSLPEVSLHEENTQLQGRVGGSSNSNFTTVNKLEQNGSRFAPDNINELVLLVTPYKNTTNKSLQELYTIKSRLCNYNSLICKNDTVPSLPHHNTKHKNKTLTKLGKRKRIVNSINIPKPKRERLEGALEREGHGGEEGEAYHHDEGNHNGQPDEDHHSNSDVADDSSKPTQREEQPDSADGESQVVKKPHSGRGRKPGPKPKNKPSKGSGQGRGRPPKVRSGSEGDGSNGEGDQERRIRDGGEGEDTEWDTKERGNKLMFDRLYEVWGQWVNDKDVKGPWKVTRRRPGSSCVIDHLFLPDSLPPHEDYANDSEVEERCASSSTSNYCHSCGDSGILLMCTNSCRFRGDSRTPLCTRVFCYRCFRARDWDFTQYLQSGKYICSHCQGTCYHTSCTRSKRRVKLDMKQKPVPTRKKSSTAATSSSPPHHQSTSTTGKPGKGSSKSKNRTSRSEDSEDTSEAEHGQNSESEAERSDSATNHSSSHQDRDVTAQTSESRMLLRSTKLTHYLVNLVPEAVARAKSTLRVI